MQVRNYRLPPLPGKKNAPVQVKLKSEKMITKQPIRYNSIKRPSSSSKQRQDSRVRAGSARSTSSRDSMDSRNSRSLSRQRVNAAHYSLKTRVSMPNVTAKSWAIYQMKQQKYVYGKKTFKRKQIASLTKIMNLITVLELLQNYQLNPSKIKVRISKQASCMIGTTAQLKHDMQFTLQNLFYGMMLPSGNDAAYQIAQICGSLTIMMKQSGCIDKSIVYDCQKLTQFSRNKSNTILIFLQQMNRLSKQIGMINSNFANPHGLSNIQNYSTADDICKLCVYSMKNQKFRQIVNTENYYCQYLYSQDSTNKQNCDENQFQKGLMVWENTNRMLKEGWNGIKTGITPNAGPCLAASKKQIINNKQYEFFVVLINSKSMDVRWKQVKQIVQWVISQGVY